MSSNIKLLFGHSGTSNLNSTTSVIHSMAYPGYTNTPTLMNALQIDLNNENGFNNGPKYIPGNAIGVPPGFAGGWRLCYMLAPNFVLVYLIGFTTSNGSAIWINSYNDNVPRKWMGWRTVNSDSSYITYDTASYVNTAILSPTSNGTIRIKDEGTYLWNRTTVSWNGGLVSNISSPVNILQNLPFTWQSAEFCPVTFSVGDKVVAQGIALTGGHAVTLAAASDWAALTTGVWIQLHLSGYANLE